MAVAVVQKAVTYKAKTVTFPDRRAIVAEQVKQTQEAAQAQQNAAIVQTAQVPAIIPQTVSTPPIEPQTSDGSPMMNIFMRESGNRTDAINASSGACGLGQAEPCGKMPCSLSDYACQVNFFTAYANDRYGGWPQAWAAWQSQGWW